MSSSPVKIVVKNEGEVERAFRNVRRDVQKGLRPTLRAAAEPVRQEAADLFSNYDVPSAMGYKVRIRARGVAVEQSLRRTTGEHPFFGTLQMRDALVPALEHHGEDVRDTIARMVDLAGIKNGF